MLALYLETRKELHRNSPQPALLLTVQWKKPKNHFINLEPRARDLSATLCVFFLYSSIHPYRIWWGHFLLAVCVCAHCFLLFCRLFNVRTYAACFFPRAASFLLLATAMRYQFPSLSLLPDPSNRSSCYASQVVVTGMGHVIWNSLSFSLSFNVARPHIGTGRDPLTRWHPGGTRTAYARTPVGWWDFYFITKGFNSEIIPSIHLLI